jgi:uncharacterized protein YjiS (DUF1127 family)
MGRHQAGGRKRELLHQAPLAGLRLTAFVEVAQIWAERASQRRALAALDDPALKDIGVSRADAEAEAAKPFWRP